MYRWFVLPLATLLACAPAVQQTAPAAPAPEAQSATVTTGSHSAPEIIPPPEFRQAVERGTRTATGEPGPAYWQNFTDYQLDLRVDTEEPRVEGTAIIRYHNNSPHTLPGLVLDLTQNFHAPGGMRLETVEITGGMELQRITVNGQEIQTGALATDMSGYQTDGTKLIILLPEPLSGGASIELGIDWSVAIPAQGAGGRMGHNAGNLIHLAYFYPQMAVFDDVIGWSPDHFLGTAEFYSGFGNYEVTVEAPAGWLVAGTGRLINAEEVLAPAVLERLALAEQSDTVVHVVTSAQLDEVTRASSGTQRWTFRADSIRDVAYSLTRESVWDAARTPIGDRDGDGTVDYARVDAIYRNTAPLWTELTGYAQHALSFLSEYTGMPYPWPHMTSVEGAGIIGGGMEFPMITLMGDYTAAGADALYSVTAHEFAHMWVPMQVATDERRYAWVDEGMTNFAENQSREDFSPGIEAQEGDRGPYLNIARAEQEGEIMRRSDYHYPGNSYVIATYYKPSTLLATLRSLLGEETFLEAYRTFLQRWRYKHPYPWDLWNTFEDVSGQDLSWFWKSWYYTTGVLDQAVESVAAGPQGTRIVISSPGDIPMPTRLSIELDDGSTLEREISVEQWFGGVRENVLEVPGTVTRVEIDPQGLFPDVDRQNNVWTR